jgi:sulfoacetaldehyde acetyltransferase
LPLKLWKKQLQQSNNHVRIKKKGITTFIEVILNQELGEPFRRDAMKKPVEVAGIEKGDMKPQKSLVG